MAEERVQRRLAAILAADVVGYSRLIEADEEGTRVRLRSLHAELIDPRIAADGGRIVKTMGDGILVEFPSAVDAVRNALDIQAAMGRRNADIHVDSRIDFRVGINVGDIIVEGDDIHGDGVNVAARLEGLCEPGAVYVSGTVYDQAAGKLAAAFEDLGEQTVKNIAKPVRVYRAGEEVKADYRPDALTLADKPAIAVLPFDNLSGDPEQEYFSDGMAEDLITDLSKLSNLSVAARNSSFSFKGQMPNIKDVAEKLGVAFVLEGSVRKMGDRLRINAQLIDGADGRHLWAERYDGDMAEIFEFQDNIREEIVAALQVNLTPADKTLAERKPTDSVEAYDLFLKGRANFHRTSREHLLEAINCLEAAIEVDPNFADAYGYLSYCHFLGWIHMWPGFDDNLERAHELAEKGVALDGRSGIALTRLGWIQTFLRRHDQAVANLEKAIAVAPNDAEVYSSFGVVLNYRGNPERGLEMLEKAFSLEMFAPPIWEFQIGYSHFLLRHLDETLTRCNRAIEQAPMLAPPNVLLACAYVELDRLDDASGAIKTILEINPRFTVKEIAKRLPFRVDEDRDRILDGLRKAGLPESSEPDDAALPEKPSIAVLPFDNMSGDPEQEFFTDGLAEDIITALSKIERMRVIARHSTFEYKGQALDLRRIAEELGVRYVLEGSVRRGGDRLRITAQLIDADDGSHLWAERYDRPIDDLFDIQDEITKEIVTSLRVKLTDGETARVWARGTNNIEAWQNAVRAFELFMRLDSSSYLEARTLAEKATELDPDYANAWAVLGLTYWFDGRLGYTGDTDAKFARAAELAEHATALEANESWAIGLSALAAAALGRHDEGVAIARRGIELHPGNADVRGYLGLVLMHAGNYREAVEHTRAAMSLNPFYPNWYRAIIARALTFLDEFDEALTVFDEILNTEKTNFITRLFRTYIYWHSDREPAARDEVAEVRKIAPNLCVSHLPSLMMTSDAAALQRFSEVMRQAGLPE